jgi:transcriptional regulator with XRE-family HTH domain
VNTRRDGLRQRREELGLTQEDIAARLGVSTTTYRNWERGTFLPRIGHRPHIARQLDVAVEEVATWFGTTNDRVSAPRGMSVPAWLGHLATLEQGASRILTYEPVVVPGLLQTEDYAMAVERVGRVTHEDVVERVQARIARQAVLYRDDNPLELSVLLDESVLHRRAGTNDVMIDQLEHLATVPLTFPTIEIRILPLEAEAFHAAWGSFVVLTSPGSTEPYMACAVDGVGARYLDRPGEVASHVEAFELLSEVALPPTESRVLIAATQERYR